MPMTTAEALAAIRLRTVVISTLDGKQIVGVPEATLRHLGFLLETARAVDKSTEEATLPAPSETMDPAHEAWMQELM